MSNFCRWQGATTRNIEIFREGVTQPATKRAVGKSAIYARTWYNLPNIHKDPFDRLLVSQAQLENLPIITYDKMIKKYDIKILW